MFGKLGMTSAYSGGLPKRRIYTRRNNAEAVTMLMRGGNISEVSSGLGTSITNGTYQNFLNHHSNPHQTLPEN